MPYLRSSSSMGTPASACCSTWTIWSPEQRDLLMGRSFPRHYETLPDELSMLVEPRPGPGPGHRNKLRPPFFTGSQPRATAPRSTSPKTSLLTTRMSRASATCLTTSERRTQKRGSPGTVSKLAISCSAWTDCLFECIDHPPNLLGRSRRSEQRSAGGRGGDGLDRELVVEVAGVPGVDDIEEV